LLKAKITALGCYTPPRIMTNHELEKMVDTNDQWIRERTGISERHVAEPDVATSDLATEAAKAALAARGIEASELDAILVCTVTPDMFFPATACLVQNNLGARKAWGFDLIAACSGFVFGLTTGAHLIAGGMHRKVLVIGADTMTRIIDYTERGTCVLFGDGAGAVVLEASETPGILASDLHADGKHVDILCVPGTVFGGKVHGNPLLRMDGQAVFKLAVGVLEDAARATLAKAGKTDADIDWLIPHQANIRIMQSTARRLKMSMDKLIVTVDQHGNTSAASIPLALDAAVRSGKIKKGDTLMLEGVCGGFTWGAVLLDF
jgi:3-oxoacyl-[acyl-carrier-protein] synthase III